jgi:hypothetical protein
MASLDKTLAKGLTLHRLGRLAEARACYEINALYLPGLASAADGFLDRGTALITQAVRINPRFAPALFNLCKSAVKPSAQ